MKSHCCSVQLLGQAMAKLQRIPDRKSPLPPGPGLACCGWPSMCMSAVPASCCKPSSRCLISTCTHQSHVTMYSLRTDKHFGQPCSGFAGTCLAAFAYPTVATEKSRRVRDTRGCRCLKSSTTRNWHPSARRISPWSL